jgi:activator of 2-hydroxyglutaryl-CoA dehydratase
MAVAGIDVGSQSTKVVILEGYRIVAAVALRALGLKKRHCPPEQA